MSVNITVGSEEYILTDIEYWGQRLFAKATNIITEEVFNVVSTKGFDQLWIKSNRGNKFKFKSPEKFNPYLCNKEKDIYYESQLIEKHEEKYEVSDIGPSSYNGTYKFWFKLGQYNDDYYFETKKLEVSGFDLFQYQAEDLYYTAHASQYHDKMPKLYSGLDTNLFGKINIIHGVTDINGKITEIFDTESINNIIGTDIGFSEHNNLYLIARAAGYNGIINSRRIGVSNFALDGHIEIIKNDCGNAYIHKNLLRKVEKRRYALRYLYEYFRCVNSICNSKRKQAPPVSSGPKEFKKEEFIPIFMGSNATEFKIIWFNNIFTVEKKIGISRVVSGDDIFSVNGSYDYINGKPIFDEFDSKYELMCYVRKHISVDASIKLSTILAKWLPDTLGYMPRTCLLHTLKKANAAPITDILSLYCIPTVMHNTVLNDDAVYVNLYSLLANFGIHNLKIRNILQMNEFTTNLFDMLNFKFEVYHVCRDIRRGIFKWDHDANLSDCMINLNDALGLLYIFAEAGDKKNSYWFSNANMLIQTFPDAKFDQDEVSLLYMPHSLKNFVENQG